MTTWLLEGNVLVASSIADHVQHDRVRCSRHSNLAAKLAMGHPGSVSRVVPAGRTDISMTSKLPQLESMLIREQ